jgi:uncharacterized Zn finger protein
MDKSVAMTSDKVFTQAEVDRIVSERLARHNEEEQAVRTELAEYKSKDSKNILDALKAKVASEVKLPASLIGFVQGSDEATIKASAEALLTGIGPGPNVGGSSSPAGGNTAPHIYTKAEIESMKPEQINQDWTNIQKQLASGQIK